MTSHSLFTAGDGTELAYRLEGPVDAPLLVLSNSIATTTRMWDGQVAELCERFRVLRYDTRGHGASGVPVGAYSFDRLGRDVVELLDHLGISRATFLGLSLGGFIGQWLGVHVPERIERLILVNTSPYLGPSRSLDAQIAGLRAEPDMATTAERFLGNWFPPHLRDDEHVVAKFRDDLLALDPAGLAGSLAAVRDADMRRTNALIESPTLIIAGEHDTVTRPEHGRAIAETIAGARFVLLPSVHMTNVELPDAFMHAVGDFLTAAASAQA